MGSDRRIGLLLLAGGCVPFAAGALADRDGGGLLPPCPFRAATGLPCPFCGATRAFALAARGDGDWLSYNAPWVVLAALAVVAGALALAGVLPLARLRPRPGVLAAAAVLVTCVAWAYALVQRGPIAS
jgi:hypothetical protein